MTLRLDESGGRLPHVRVLMLLDRIADLFLARRAGAEGWLIKPLDSLRLRRAATTIMGGGTIYEGLPADTPCAVPVPTDAPTRPNRPVATRCRPGSIARRTPGSSAAWLARHVRDVEAGSSNLPSPTARRPPIPVAVRREGGTDGASMREGDAGRARDPHRASSAGARPDPRHPGRGLAEQPAPAPPGDDRRLDHAGVHERGDLPHRPLVAGDRRRRAGVHAVPLPDLRATRRSGRPPARPGAAGPASSTARRARPQLERGARDRPAAPQLHGQDRGLLGAGAGQQGAARPARSSTTWPSTAGPCSTRSSWTPIASRPASPPIHRATTSSTRSSRTTTTGPALVVAQRARGRPTGRPARSSRPPPHSARRAPAVSPGSRPWSSCSARTTRSARWSAWTSAGAPADYLDLTVDERLAAAASFTVWRPAHFAAEWASWSQAIRADPSPPRDRRHGAGGDHPAGRPAGVGTKVRPGSRYFPYYTRPWITDEDFDPRRDPHLTEDEARAIDSAIDAYNETIIDSVADRSHRRPRLVPVRHGWPARQPRHPALHHRP